MPSLTLRQETWPLVKPFTIARGTKTEAPVITVELTDGGHRGRGEGSPTLRYGETPDSVLAQLESVRAAVEAGADRSAIQDLLPHGAARNALDCAFWDLEAKRAGQPAWSLAGFAAIHPVQTVFTLSLDTPEAMGEQAAHSAARPILKLKIGTGDLDLARVEAVRANAPKTRLVVDANEGLDFDSMRKLLPEMKRLGVLMVEQPIPAAEDEQLEGFDSPVPLFCDESIHTRADLDRCARRYSGVNIKLDKTGGLTEALLLAQAAKARGLPFMVGCMLGTSLSMAPGVLAAQGAEFVDLDGPLFMKEDRVPPLTYMGSIVEPPVPALWG